MYLNGSQINSLIKTENCLKNNNKTKLKSYKKQLLIYLYIFEFITSFSIFYENVYSFR